MKIIVALAPVGHSKSKLDKVEERLRQEGYSSKHVSTSGRTTTLWTNESSSAKALAQIFSDQELAALKSRGITITQEV